MPGQIKVSGTWHNAKALKVKATVSGASTWHAVSSGWIIVAGTWRQWFVGAVVDTFTRTTSGTLGTSDTGNSWTSLFGTWFSNGSQAQSNDSVSSGTAGALSYITYGLADNTVIATPTSGTGPAFWVTSGGSWWGAFIYSDQTTSSGYYAAPCITCASCGADCTNCGSSQTGSTCNSCTHTGGSCGFTTSCPSGWTYCSSGTSGSGCYQNGTGCTGAVQGATITGITCTNTDCAACGSTPIYTCNTCTNCACGCSQYTFYAGGTVTNYYIRIVSSTSTGAAYTVQTTGLNLGQLPGALVATTSGTGVSVSAYTDTTLTTQIGSTVTATNGGTIGTNYGIVKAYGNYNQGSTADNFSIGA